MWDVAGAVLEHHDEHPYDFIAVSIIYDSIGIRHRDHPWSIKVECFASAGLGLMLMLLIINAY